MAAILTTPNRESHIHQPLRIFLAAMAANALFAVMNIFVKLASDTHPVAQIMFFRQALALIPVCIVIAASGGGRKFLITKNPGGHVVRSLVGLTGMVFFFLSYALLPLANATALQSASPLLQTLLSVPMLGEHVGPHRLGAVIIGLGAVLFMLRPSSTGHLGGSLTALAAALLNAFTMIIIRRLGRTEHPLTIVFYFTLTGAILCGLTSFFFWVPPTAQSLFYLVMMGLSGGCAQMLMTYSFARAPTAYVSAFSYISIMFGGIADWLVWHHMIEWHIAAGSAVIISTGLYILHRETLKTRRITNNTQESVQGL